MRIALLIDQLTLGGTELQMMQLMAGLSQSGHRVSVRSLRNPEPAAAAAVEAMIASGVSLLSPATLIDRRLPVPLIVRWLREVRPDVLIASMSRAESVAAAAMRLPGVGAFPLVGTRRSLISNRSEPTLKRRLRAWSATSLDGVVANSRAALEDCRLHEPVAGKLQAVIPNIVGTQWFQDVVPTETDSVHPTVATVANLRPPKGHRTLLDALVLLQECGYPVTAYLIGSGPMEAELKDRAADAGLDVRFLGPVADPHPAINGVDLYVHPSDSEGMPNAVLEAMGAGCAVVATDVGGTAEALGTAGVLVPPRDPLALATAMRRLLQAPGERARLGHAARERALNFTLESCVDSYVEFFGRLSSKSASPVIIIVVNLGPGGAEKQAIALANHLVHRRPVSILALSDNDFRLPELDPRVGYGSLGVREGEKNPIRLAGALIKARRQLSPAKDPLLISFTYPAHVLGWSLQSTRRRLRHIVSERNSDLGANPRVQLRKIAYRFTTRVTTNARSTAIALEDRGVSAPGGVSVIPNVVEPVEPRRRVTSHEPFRWICVASLTAQKDHRTLLAAVSELQGRGRRFELSLVGGGELQQALRVEVADRGLSDSVHFLGVRSDVPQLITGADALVLSSQWEGLPNAILEAVTEGLPIAATRVGGVAQAIPEECSDFLAPPRDPLALAEIMQRIMDFTDAQRAEIQTKLRRHACSRFSAATVLGSWDQVIDEVDRVSVPRVPTRQPA